MFTPGTRVAACVGGESAPMFATVVPTPSNAPRAIGARGAEVWVRFDGRTGDVPFAARQLAPLPPASLTDAESDHVDFLRETLIPDLRDSGSDFTADDFATCLAIIDRLSA